MDYKNVNPRDEWGGEKDARGGLLRCIRAIRGSLPKLDHGFHGFPAAWPRLIWVTPSRTQSHSVKPVKPRTADHSPLALLCGFLGKGRTSLCKSLISMIVLESLRFLAVFGGIDFQNDPFRARTAAPARGRHPLSQAYGPAGRMTLSIRSEADGGRMP
jgi:hypothetical protein